MHLARHFALKKEVKLTLFSRKFSAHLKKLGAFPNVNLVKGDYNDILELVPIVNNQDIVYHLISSSVPATSWIQPTLEIQNNLIPTINLFRLCSDLGVKKIVFTSSGGTVYGNQTTVLSENHSLMPFSPYGIIKVTIEHFLEYFYRKNGINYDIYRISNIYGPGLNKTGFGVINTWLNATKNNQSIRVFGDGSAAKDYIYIDDVIHLIGNSLNKPFSSSNTYNVCSSTTITLNKILETIKKVTKTNPSITYEHSLKSDNQIVTLDNTKILSEFPNFEFTPFEKGIKKIWDNLNT